MWWCQLDIILVDLSWNAPAMPGADATDIHASSRPEGGPGNAVVTAMAAVAKSAQNREVSPAGEQQQQQHIVVVSHNSSSKREKTQAKKNV